jgi:hypothetical protein
MSSRVGDLLHAVLSEAGLETTADIWRISEIWSDAVGSRIAVHAAPLRLVRGELVVAAPLAVWRQELALLGPEIAANVNLRLGKPVVERVRLVAAQLTPPDLPRATRRRLREPATESSRSDPWLPARPAVGKELATALEALHRARNARLAEDRAALTSEIANRADRTRAGRAGSRDARRSM